MVSGKGSSHYWVAIIKAGRVLYEITKVAKDVALRAI